MTDQPTTPDADDPPPRPYADVLADAIRVLTEVARLSVPGGTRSPEGDGDRIDFGEFVTLAVAATAANIGGVDQLLAGRPGSWEADSVRNMLHSTVGHDEQHLFAHRTEPLVVTVHVDNILNDLGYAALYDDAEDELIRRKQAIDADTLTDEQEAELTRIEELHDRLEQLRRAHWTAYGDAFRDQVLAAAAEQYPDLRVPVDVVIELDWHDDGDPGDWWGPAEQVLSLAHARTPLPGSGIAPKDYTGDQLRDLAAIERAAGRDPLTRLDST